MTMLTNSTNKAYSDSTRNIQRSSAPVSLAVFLYLNFGTPASFFNGRVKRRQYNTRKGNRPGATVYALVETRLPATNWWSLTTKNIQEAPMPNHAQVTPDFDVITYAIIQSITTLDGQTSHMPLVYDLPTLSHAQKALTLTSDSSAFVAKYTEHYYHDQAAYQSRLEQLGRVH